MPQKCRVCDVILGLLKAELSVWSQRLERNVQDYKFKVKQLRYEAFKTLTQIIGIQLGGKKNNNTKHF